MLCGARTQNGEHIANSIECPCPSYACGNLIIYKNSDDFKMWKLLLFLTIAISGQQSSITIMGRICSSEPITISNGYMQNLIDSMDPYLSSCSYAKTRMPLGEMNIVVGPVDIPCGGVIPVGFQGNGIAWSGYTCNNIDYLGWITFAQNYVKTVYKIDPANFNHTILVMFGNVTLKCPWSGLSDVSCSANSNCHIWLQSLGLANIYYEQQSMILHELGHNWGLLHSSTPGSEYGDFSCAMASCCGERCYNVYQSRKMGWSLPIASIVEPLKGTWYSYVIPGLLLTDTNHITIDLNATIDKGLYFISFRVPYGYDIYLLPYLQNMVYVHYIPSKNIDALQKPILYAMLSAMPNNNTYVLANTITIKVDNINYGVNADISFCIPWTGTKPCGVDINCDGIIEECTPMPLPLPLATNNCTCCCS